MLFEKDFLTNYLHGAQFYSSHFNFAQFTRRSLFT